MIKIEVPIQTISEANCSEHWSKKARRHKKQQYIIRWAFKPYETSVQLPCTVKMTRISPRTLDSSDNLPMSLKWVKDEISEILIPEKKGYYINKQGHCIALKGRSDDDVRIKWEYDQKKGMKYGVVIEINFDEIK